MSFSFDRAAEYYDATRSLPPDTHQVVTDALFAEVSGRTTLEIGVGTGRFALSLAQRGVSMVGVDLSLVMLRRLIANAGGHQPFPLAVADATRLPVGDSSFEAVVASHVLHLIENWAAAVDETLRVLKPGGVFVVDFGGAGPSPWKERSEEVLKSHGVVHEAVGTRSADEAVRYLDQRVVARPLPPITMTFQRSLVDDLRDWECQIFGWTWRYTPEQMRTACAAVRTWAEVSGWPVEEQFDLERTIQWWVFERVN